MIFVMAAKQVEIPGLVAVLWLGFFLMPEETH